MKPTAPCLGDARVRHLPGQGVLEGVLALAGGRRAGARPDEVAVLEHVEARLRPVEDMRNRARPEHTTDHRRSLERSLLRRRQAIDARGEHGVYRVRNGEPLR
jgi:hypothetical protein